MKAWKRLGAKGSYIFGAGVALTLLLAVACGAAATATPAPAKAPQPAVAQPAAPVAPAAEAKPAPVTAATATPPPAPAAKPAPTATPVPIAKPAPTAAPPAAVVNPGKVTWMIGGWGNERFAPAFFVGGNNNSMRIMQAHLIATNEKTELIPGIATDWRLSSDGLTTTLTIRKGVKFHDGTELTAEDVLWSWRHTWSTEAAAYATGIGAQSNIRIWDKAELAGPDKVSITHKVKNPAFITADLAEAGPSANVVLPKRTTLHDAALEAAYDRNPIGVGPMKLVRRVPAAVMEFERFEDFYYQPKNGLPEDRRVKFKSLDLRLVPEEATRVAAIRAGEADLAPVSLATKKQVEAGGGRLVFGREGVVFVTFFATCWVKAEAPCNNKQVRQALDYAINKELMMDKLYGGATVAQAKGWVQVSPSTIGYSPELDPRPFNPDKARQLLAEAGYAGGKGFGKLIINTWVSTSLPLLPESAQLAADFWRRELGLDVEVKVGEEAALKKAWLSQELNGQILWRENEARLDASGWARNFYGIPTAANRFHNDPGLFEEVQKAIGVFDPVERSKVLNNLYRRLRDENYELGIGYINIPWAVGPRILAWQPYPLAFYPSNLHGITLKP